MQRGDVSFTFLDRVKEVEQNIEDGRWQSALALALTLPDICGGIAFPDIVRRYRDGRMILDRQKNPTRDVGGQYIRWFDEFAEAYFKLSPEDERPYICGERCWQLRCEYLHQNKGFLNDEDEDTVRFHLGVNCGTSVCHLDETEYQEDGLDIRIDIEQFCLRMCRAARNYYEIAHEEKDFSLYNTPVLDFVMATKSPETDVLMAIVCKDETYAKGLSQVLAPFGGKVVSFRTIEEAKKKNRNGKPDIWIAADANAEEAVQLWGVGKHTPLIFLNRVTSKIETDAIRKENISVLEMPVRPQILRECVQEHMNRYRNKGV